MKKQIIIEVETNLKKFSEKDFDNKNEHFDLTKELEEDLHNAIFEVIREYIVDYPYFQNEVIGELNGDCPKNVQTFDDFGKINISVGKVGFKTLDKFGDD